MASTASRSVRPCSRHRDRHVQNETAWATTARSRRPEAAFTSNSLNQPGAELGVTLVYRLLAGEWYRGLVAVDSGEHRLARPVEPVQINEAHSKARQRVRGRKPCCGVGWDLSRKPVR